MAKSDPDLPSGPRLFLEVEGNEVVAIRSEYAPTLAYRLARRKTAFSQLRRFGLVPRKLLDLAERGEVDTLVKLKVTKLRGKVGFRFSVKVLDDLAASRMPFCLRRPMSASAALALVLRMILQQLRKAQRTRTAAPVRTKGLVPRSLIGEIAMDLLEDCRYSAVPPSEQLNKLFEELLSLDRDMSSQREYEARHRAAAILAETPQISTRELSRTLDVNAGTISRWRRNEHFKSLVTHHVKARKKVLQYCPEAKLDDTNVVVLE